MENIFSLGFMTTVKFYPYRTARVCNTFFEMDRYTEEGKQFEGMLNKASGENCCDNHTAYTITDVNGNCIYVQCSDYKIRIGSVLKEERW